MATTQQDTATSSLPTTMPSPVGDSLPLRDYNMQRYELSPSPQTPSGFSPSQPHGLDVSPFHYFDSDGVGKTSAVLTWRALKVSIQEGKGKSSQMVLEDVSGFAEPAHMLAIMGPPGSGKSTLLNALAGRLTRKALFNGEILLNGRRQQLTYGTAAHVTQEDALIGTLTVRETIHLSALLRLPDTMPHTQKMAIAESAILDMGLKECASTPVGNWHLQGLSNGEKRRLCIALELLMRPRLLYLDEPTNGLDGAESLLVMAKLKSLARDGRTIISCFQNPSSQVFELLENICLLAQGKMVYFGDASGAIENFARAGFPCPVFRNPAEHFLRALDSSFDHVKTFVRLVQDPETADLLEREEVTQVIKVLVDAYQKSDIGTTLSTYVDELSAKKGAVLVHKGKHASFILQTAILAYRSFLNMTRDLGYYWLRMGAAILLMIVTGSIFLRIGDSFDPVQARSSCLFFVLEALMFLAIASSPLHCQEMQVFVRERRNPHYGISAYALGTLLSCLPFLFLMSLVSSCIVYFLVELHAGFGHFMYFVCILFFSLLVVESLMMAIAAIVPNYFVAMIVGTGFQSIFMLVGGYFRLARDIPRPIWTYPLSYISFHTYAIRGMFENEFRGLMDLDNSLQLPGAMYKLEHPGKWKDVVILLCMAVFYNAVFLCIHFSVPVHPAPAGFLQASTTAKIETLKHGDFPGSNHCCFPVRLDHWQSGICILLRVWSHVQDIYKNKLIV